MKILKQSFVLLLSFGFVALWEFTPLNGFIIPLLGIFSVGLLISFLRRRKHEAINVLGDNPYITVFLVNTIVFLVVLVTGGINSPLFLLLYFVGFAISFLFDPLVVFVYLLGTAAILTPLIIQDDIFGNAVKCSTILLVGPLAYFFGRSYQKEEDEDNAILALEQEAHDKAAAIEKSVVEILDEEKDVMDEKSLDELKKVLKESDELREETKQE